MSSAVKTVSRARRIGSRVAIGSAIIVSLGAAYAFKTLYARPGEAAIALIPANALVVGSVDLSPSPQQTITFKNIDDALARNGLDKYSNKSVLDIIEHSPMADELRPFALRNAAFAGLPKDAAKGVSGGISPVLLLAVSDGQQVQSILKKDAKLFFWKGTQYYKTKGSDAGMLVIDDVLVVAQDPESLSQIRRVKQGDSPSINTVAAFNDARAKAIGDANLMVFASPDLMGGKDGPMGAWATASMAIRDGGFEFSGAGMVDTAKDASLQKISKAVGLRPDLFSVLPAGSYGVTAISQPGVMFSGVEGELQNAAGKGEKTPIDQISDTSTQAFGVDLHNDVIPALKGDTIAAFYPTHTAPNAGVDVLLIMDDSNGADPATVVEKVQQFVREQGQKNGEKREFFTKTQRDGASFYRIGDEFEKEMHKGMSSNDTKPVVKTDLLFGNKTMAWATIDHVVIVSSSQELLDKAVASYKSKANSLAEDPGYGSTTNLNDGSQTVMTFNLARIAEGVENSMNSDNMGKDDASMLHSVLDAFKTLNSPLYVKAKVSDNGQFSTGLFIPMNYDKMIDFVGSMMNKK